MNDMHWGTVLSVAGLFLIGCAYVARQINRCERRLSERIDRLTERYTDLEYPR